jgi:hypothetical protein
VTMPPVPHCVPVVLVSAVREEMSSTSWMGVAVGSICKDINRQQCTEQLKESATTSNATLDPA